MSGRGNVNIDQRQFSRYGWVRVEEPSGGKSVSNDSGFFGVLSRDERAGSPLGDFLAQ